MQSNPDHIFVNVPAQVHGPGASGAGQSHSLDSLFRFKEDGRTMESPEAPGCPHKTHVLVSSFGLCPPFGNLRDSQNPLVQMAESGVQVTAINHWKAEGSAAEAAALAGALGVFPPSIVTRIGSFRVRKNFDLVHPPFQQHKKQGDGWCVRGRRHSAPGLPHPSALPRELRVRGCMHTKLIMVRWSDGTLRVSVSSGNLGSSEWSFMAEVGHVQTFSAFQSGGQALGGVSRARAAAPCEADTGCGGAPAPSPATTTLFLTPSTGVAGDMLCSMLSHMQVSQATIDALLTGINFNALSTGELVIARPGFHYRTPKRTPAAASSAPSPLSTAGKKRGAKSEAVVSSSRRLGSDYDEVVLGEAAGTGLDGAPVPSKRARFGQLPWVEAPLLASTPCSFSADVSAAAPIKPAPLDRKRAALLARLSSENFDLDCVGCSGHIALRALQRYGRFAVAALVNATLPWSAPLPRGGKTASRDSLVSERVRTLIPIDGLLVQGSSLGGCKPPRASIGSRVPMAFPHRLSFPWRSEWQSRETLHLLISTGCAQRTRLSCRSQSCGQNSAQHCAQQWSKRSAASAGMSVGVKLKGPRCLSVPLRRCFRPRGTYAARKDVAAFSAHRGCRRGKPYLSSSKYRSTAAPPALGTCRVCKRVRGGVGQRPGRRRSNQTHSHLKLGGVLPLAYYVRARVAASSRCARRMGGVLLAQRH